MTVPNKSPLPPGEGQGEGHNVLTDNLPLLAGAPNGIKKLRELILELAVRGKLVPQDPSDEPASELLKLIEREKTQLIEQKVIRKGKLLPPDIEQDEIQFKLPIGWEWIRLGQIGDWGAGATPARGNSSYYGGEMPWFKSGELVADFISVSEETVTELALKECSLRRNKPGDVLIAMYGATIGKTAILNVEGTTNQAVCACTPLNGVFNRYLLLTLKAMKSNFIGQGAGGAQPNISREKIVATVTGLPPLAEQYRIVAKVDELMALCDRLEARQTDADSAHTQLVQALLDSLTQAPDAKDFAQSWQRLAEHFHTLFITESSIDALKQTLLQLAVMGKLVPQDPNDEPASELLKRIAEERAQLVAEGKLKKQKPLANIAQDEKPLELPKGWGWARFGDLILEAYTGLDRGKSLQGMHLKYPYFKMNNILNRGGYSTSEMTRVDGGPEEIEKYRLFSGDLLFNTRNSRELVGKTCVIRELPESIVLYNNNILRCKFSESVLPEVIDLWLRSTTGSTLLDSIKSNTTNVCAIYQGNLFNLLCPAIPPNEQHRIAAKVDQLMTLCDQLKTRLTQARQVHEQLANALVEQAVA